MALGHGIDGWRSAMQDQSTSLPIDYERMDEFIDLLRRIEANTRAIADSLDAAR
jgi:hypothetical protein